MLEQLKLAAASIVHACWTQPSVPMSLSIAVLVTLALGTVVVFAVFDTDAGAGSKRTLWQRAFGMFVACGRLRNLICSPCDRARGRYPIANTCQIPFFKDLSDVYNFVFGYKTAGLAVEVGAFE